MTTTDFSTLLSTSDLLSTTDFITELFCRVDDAMKNVTKHRQAKLHPSEIVTLGLLLALKGRGNRAFYRWTQRDLLPLFPHLPERTRLFRLFAKHVDWTRQFLSEPTLLGVVDSYGIELIHPKREGRSPKQIGKKGLSNHRWIVGVKLCFVLNRFGLVCDWDVNTANVHDTKFHPLIQKFDQQMLILADKGFHAKNTQPKNTQPKNTQLSGDPCNLKICAKHTWNCRIVIETVLSMLTGVCQIKRLGHRGWFGLKARLAFALAAFNLCTQWRGLSPDEQGFVPLSMVEFAL